MGGRELEWTAQAQLGLARKSVEQSDCSRKKVERRHEGRRGAKRTVSLPVRKYAAARDLEMRVTTEDEGLANPKTEK